MTTASVTRPLLWLGPAILVGAIAAGAFLLFGGRSFGDIDSVLAIAIPVLVLTSLAGFMFTLIGAIGWALRAPIRKLVWLGFGLVGLAGVCFAIGERIQFGFDDPSVLFMQAATYTPLLVGFVFLLSAGIRHWRMG